MLLDDVVDRGVILDRAKVAINVSGSGASGLAVEEDLVAKGMPVELADLDTVVPIISVNDDIESVDAFVDEVTASVERQRTDPRPVLPSISWTVEPQVVMSPRDAYFAEHQTVSAEDAIGAGVGRARRALPAWHSGADSGRADHRGSRRRAPRRDVTRNPSALRGRPHSADLPDRHTHLSSPRVADTSGQWPGLPGEGAASASDPRTCGQVVEREHGRRVHQSVRPDASTGSLGHQCATGNRCDVAECSDARASSDCGKRRDDVGSRQHCGERERCLRRSGSRPERLAVTVAQRWPVVVHPAFSDVGAVGESSATTDRLESLKQTQCHRARDREPPRAHRTRHTPHA